MNSWYSLALGDALTAQVMLGEIRAACVASSGGASDFAVFQRQESGELHCDVTAYFSPAAATLARRFGGEPCARPGRRGLELLAGDAASWGLWPG